MLHYRALLHYPELQGLLVCMLSKVFSVDAIPVDSHVCDIFQTFVESEKTLCNLVAYQYPNPGTKALRRSYG